jgi:hypothetical protein
MIARFRRRTGIPRIRTPRRRRLILAVSAVVLSIAIGEVTADVVSSGPASDLMQERSYVAAVVPVIDESTALATWLTEIRDRPAQIGRQGLLIAVGRLLTGSRDVRTQLDSLGIPSPDQAASSWLDKAFATRERVARTLAGAITTALTAGGSSRALAGMQAVASGVRESDGEYLRFVAALPSKAKQHTVALPPSSWATSASWTAASLSAYVAVLGSDPQLRLRHDLAILAVSVEPPVISITPTTTTTTTSTTTTTMPSTISSTTSSTTTTTLPPGASSTSSTTSTTSSTTTSTSTTTTTLQIPPANSTSHVASTRRLQAVVVIANGGNVAENGVEVTANLTAIRPPTSPGTGGTTGTTGTTAPPPPLPAPETVRDRVGTMPAGGSRQLVMPAFSTRPGTLYFLTVTIDAAAGAPGTRGSETVRIQVAG